MSDPRRVPGSLVTAKAIHVTSESECNRLYGINKKTKWVVGIVLDVLVKRNIATARTTTTIVAEYELIAGRKKVTELNLCSVKAYVPQETAVLPEHFVAVDNNTEDDDFVLPPPELPTAQQNNAEGGELLFNNVDNGNIGAAVDINNAS